MRLLPDGTVLNDRAIQKIRAGERGWQYAAALLEKFGAAPPPVEERTEWLASWLARLTRRLRHSGNYKYAWAIARDARRFLPASLPYPKPGGLPMAHPFPLFESIWTPNRDIAVTPEITEALRNSATVAIVEHAVLLGMRAKLCGPDQPGERRPNR